MEDRVTRLERKLAALKGNVEGLHAIRVSVDYRIIYIKF
jgi:plasmid maintenance system killer protein